jgi:hypothetical protein
MVQNKVLITKYQTYNTISANPSIHVQREYRNKTKHVHIKKNVMKTNRLTFFTSKSIRVKIKSWGILPKRPLTCFVQVCVLETPFDLLLV